MVRSTLDRMLNSRQLPLNFTFCQVYAHQGLENVDMEGFSWRCELLAQHAAIRFDLTAHTGGQKVNILNNLKAIHQVMRENKEYPMRYIAVKASWK